MERGRAVNRDSKERGYIARAGLGHPTPTICPLFAITRAGAREMLSWALESEAKSFLTSIRKISQV
jgi:hypothetical protein